MASVKEISNIRELADILDAVVKEQVNYADKYKEETDELFETSEVLRVFGLDSICHGEVYPDGELKFFSLIELRPGNKAFWHILFSHPRFRYKTKEVVLEIREMLKGLGVKTVDSKTERLSPSYRRWLNSLGSYPVEITYRSKL